MNEVEIMIAHLRAQVIIEEVRAKVLLQWVYNRDFNLQAQVAQKTANELMLQIERLQNANK